MAVTSGPLLSKSYFQQLRMMHTTGGQRPVAKAPPSQTDNISSGLYLHGEHPVHLVNTANTRFIDPSILHVARPNQAQAFAARVLRAIQFARGPFITINPKSSQSQHAEVPLTQTRNASSGQNTHSEDSSSFLNMTNATFETPSNAHQAHLANAPALAARLPSSSIWPWLIFYSAREGYAESVRGSGYNSSAKRVFRSEHS